MIGNTATVKSLESMLQREDASHAYLFTGPSGCGKTTLARLAASALKCTEQNLTELDSAEFGGVDMVRGLRQRSRLAGLGGGVRCYIMDECHMLSSQAQEALLKALEDPPEHVYYFLATTEPQKLRKTLKNRCTTFEVQALNDSDMGRLLKWVCTEEKKVLTPDVYNAIINVSEGSPRAALVALDKVIDLDADEVETALAQIKTVEAATIELCRALLKNEKWAKVSRILKGLKDEEPERVRRAVLGYMSAVMLGSNNGRPSIIISEFLDNFYDSGRAGLTLACWNVSG